MFKTKTRRGLSLVETVIVIALFSMIMMAVIALYLKYNTLFKVQESQVDVAGSARTIMTETHSSLLQADHIVTSHAFSGTTYTTSTSTLVMEIPAITSSGDIISNVYDYRVFYATGTDAYEVTSLGSGSARSAGIKHLSAVLNILSFTYNSIDVTTATNVIVQATTSAIKDGQTIQTALREKTYLRNI